MNKSSTKETDLEKQLEVACSGLVYISETDSPVEPFFGQKIPMLKGTEIAFDKFFDRLTAKHAWHTEAERNNAEAFTKLRDLLEAELKDIRVYKNGTIQIEITVAGRTKAGQFAGVKMKAVET